MLLAEFALEKSIVDVRAGMSIKGNNLIVEFFPNFKCLLVLHLDGLELKTFHVRDKLLELDKFEQDILDSSTVICVNFSHETEKNIDAPVVAVVMSYMQRRDHLIICLRNLLLLFEKALGLARLKKTFVFHRLHFCRIHAVCTFFTLLFVVGGFKFDSLWLLGGFILW